MKILEIILLIIPAVSWKLWKDRNGVIHPAPKEVLSLMIIWSVCMFLVYMMRYTYPQTDFHFIFLLKCLLVSITGYALIFPYAFNYLWWRQITFYNNLHIFVSKSTLRRDHIRYVLNHLSDTEIPDKWTWWRKCGWFGRLAIYIALFWLSLYWFL